MNLKASLFILAVAENDTRILPAKIIDQEQNDVRSWVRFRLLNRWTFQGQYQSDGPTQGNEQDLRALFGRDWVSLDHQERAFLVARWHRQDPLPGQIGICRPTLVQILVYKGPPVDTVSSMIRHEEHVRKPRRSMTALKGVLYQSGNLDFPRSLNEWAFRRMQDLRSDQEKRIVMSPEVAPIELSRSPELDEEETRWLEPICELINASDKVNLQRRESTLRVRKAVCQLTDTLSIVTLVSQEAMQEFADEHWKRIAYFYAYRHDNFQFDFVKLISLKNGEEDRARKLELSPRVVPTENEYIPSLTFDATGSTAAVDIVEWRGSVKENATGRFNNPDIQVHLTLQSKRPVVFLYEERPEFKNHAYLFSGEQVEKHLKRALRKGQQRAAERASAQAESSADEGSES